MIGPIHDFPYLLEQVSDHMSADKTLPLMHGVYFEARGAFLYAVATDRYTLAVTRRRLEQGPARPWSVLIGAQELKSLRAFARLNRRTPLMLERERDVWGGESLTVRAGGLRLEVPAVDGPLSEFWQRGTWRTLLADHIGQAPDMRREIRVNPTMLARWGRARGVERNEPLTVWCSGPRKPLVVACGADFIGLQMPITSDDQAPGRSEVVDGWSDLAPRQVDGERAA